MKRILTLCAACLTMGSGLLADTKIATVDLDMILFCHPKMEKTNQQLKNLHETYSDQVDNKAGKIEKLKESFKAAVEKLNDPAVSDKVKDTTRATARDIEADINKETNEFLALRDRLNKDFADTKANLFDSILDDVNEKLSKYAKDNKYDLVLNKSMNIPTVLYAAPAIDITEAVIKVTGGDVKKSIEKAKELEKQKPKKQ